MKRIFALLLCLGLALFLGCAGAEQATGLTPAQEARAIALAAGLTGLSQEQAAALSLTVEASAVGESIRFRRPQEPAYELLSQFSIGVDRRGIFRFSQPLHISDEPVQYASEQAERATAGRIPGNRVIRPASGPRSGLQRHSSARGRSQRRYGRKFPLPHAGMLLRFQARFRPSPGRNHRSAELLP